ncbi:hypothetical protein W911_12030 [Hyphomicrobium nitrativorans NL23]|uniref:Antitoxin-like ribbon-helix-helix domain-containing protein n=1 Tax=Hyphomicrobium nitrativorans NL23 TaxID=1029756 RepID=V5SG01_9HYPH|nr:ribbon-helix-helix domain-containing protein [Hyphomicrobium nitrativorans]AHB48970.1 hypothetical protein W911_12030 [Hyphomicrobium nitrativorans NL23]
MSHNKLREAMMGVQGRTEATQPAAPQPAAAATRAKPQVATRVGRRAVTVWISAEAFRQLHLIGLDKECSVQDMGVEAFNDFFRKHDKSAVA